MGGAFLFLLATPSLTRRFLEPVARARSLVWLNLGWLFAAGSVVVATLIVLSVRFMPRPIMQTLGIECTGRSGCVTLVPAWGQWAIWSFSTAMLAGLLALTIHSIVWGIRAMTKTRRLALFAGRPVTHVGSLSSGSVRVLEGAGTFAFTVGLLRPIIVLSKDLMNRLDTRELEAIVAHEAAHVAGRDNLVLLTARSLARSLRFLPGATTADRRLRRAVELAADSRASRSLGDGLLVASSLHRFASLMSVRSSRHALAGGPALAWFSDDGLIVERIGQLLEEPERIVSRFRVRFAVAILAVVTLGLAWGTYYVADVNLNLGSHPTVCADVAHAGSPRVS